MPQLSLGRLRLVLRPTLSRAKSAPAQAQAGLLTDGSLAGEALPVPTRGRESFPAAVRVPVAQEAQPITVAGPWRIRTAFPDTEPCPPIRRGLERPESMLARLLVSIAWLNWNDPPARNAPAAGRLRVAKQERPTTKARARYLTFTPRTSQNRRNRKNRRNRENRNNRRQRVDNGCAVPGWSLEARAGSERWEEVR